MMTRLIAVVLLLLPVGPAWSDEMRGPRTTVDTKNAVDGIARAAKDLRDRVGVATRKETLTAPVAPAARLSRAVEQEDSTCSDVGRENKKYQLWLQQVLESEQGRTVDDNDGLPLGFVDALQREATALAAVASSCGGRDPKAYTQALQELMRARGAVQLFVDVPVGSYYLPREWQSPEYTAPPNDVLRRMGRQP